MNWPASIFKMAEKSLCLGTLPRIRFQACSDSCEYLSPISPTSSCTLTLPNLPANCVRLPSWPRFLLQDRGRPIFGDVTFGLVCSWLSLLIVYQCRSLYAPERNLSLFAVYFASVFENGDEGEIVSFRMSCPERIHALVVCHALHLRPAHYVGVDRPADLDDLGLKAALSACNSNSQQVGG
jgi:hypothetical protein